MSLPILQPMRSLLASNCLRLATCWKIERRDGVILYFTDHDFTLTVDGKPYVSAGVDASARQRKYGLNAANAQFNGGIDSVLITTEDLRAGKYREAKVTETVVDSRYPWLGAFLTSVFWITSITYTGTAWEAQVSGLSRYLQPDVGRLYTKVCPYILGDSRCKKSLAGLALGSAISGLGSNPRKTVISAHLAGYDPYFFNNGKMEFTTGANANGEGFEIAEYDYLTGTFVFYMPLPFDAELDASVIVTAGCDGQQSTCRDKFNNILNFGGFPFVPGNEKMLSYPDSKA